MFQYNIKAGNNKIKIEPENSDDLHIQGQPFWEAEILTQNGGTLVYRLNIHHKVNEESFKKIGQEVEKLREAQGLAVGKWPDLSLGDSIITVNEYFKALLFTHQQTTGFNSSRVSFGMNKNGYYNFDIASESVVTTSSQYPLITYRIDMHVHIDESADANSLDVSNEDALIDFVKGIVSAASNSTEDLASINAYIEHLPKECKEGIDQKAYSYSTGKYLPPISQGNSNAQTRRSFTAAASSGSENGSWRRANDDDKRAQNDPPSSSQGQGSSNAETRRGSAAPSSGSIPMSWRRGSNSNERAQNEGQPSSLGRGTPLPSGRK